MPTYEVALLLRKLPRAGTATVLKRAAMKIFDTDGILFGIENLGTRPLPYKIRNHGQWNTEGGYFLMKFDSPAKAVHDIADEYNRDVDIIRVGFTKLATPKPYECELEEELQPPAYRKDVREMIAKGRKQEKMQFQYNTGLTYMPITR